MDPRRHGKRPLPADEEEEQPPPPPSAPKHEQVEEQPYHHLIAHALQQQGAASAGGSPGADVADPSPSPEAYAQYYYSARADHDATAMVSALSHVIRATPDQQQAYYPAGSAAVSGEQQHQHDAAAAAAIAEEQGNQQYLLASIHVSKRSLLLSVCTSDGESIARAPSAR